MSRRFRAFTAVSLTVIASFSMLTTPASAATNSEGHFSSNLYQVQPGFSSRTWRDNGSTGDSTRVYLGNCQVNKGGAAFGSSPLKSVEITLYNNSGWFGSRKELGRISKPCGTYDFGNHGAGDYHFVVTKINGNASANRSTFLNAGSVSVDY